jgi:hypothetical protein
MATTSLTAAAGPVRKRGRPKKAAMAALTAEGTAMKRDRPKKAAALTAEAWDLIQHG